MQIFDFDRSLALFLLYSIITSSFYTPSRENKRDRKDIGRDIIERKYQREEKQRVMITVRVFSNNILTEKRVR